MTGPPVRVIVINNLSELSVQVEWTPLVTVPIVGVAFVSVSVMLAAASGALIGSLNVRRRTSPVSTVPLLLLSWKAATLEIGAPLTLGVGTALMTSVLLFAE